MPELPPLGDPATNDDDDGGAEGVKDVEIKSGDDNEYDESIQEGVSGDTGGDAGDAGAEDPYAAHGGREVVERALALHQKVQTDEGVVQLFYEAGRAMGLTNPQIDKLFDAQTGGGEGEAEGPADDELITWGQAKELLQREVIQPFAKQTQAQAETQARGAVDSTLKELGVTDNETAAAILQMGDKYLNGDLSPVNVAQAVKRGHEDFVKLVTKNAQGYVTKKAAVAKRVPKAPAGTSGGGTAADALPEPKSVKEAIRRARLRSAGGLG